ncbi:MAG: KEOPS complex subunit Pcc1 [Haloarculaceae archaeon]
MTHHPAGDPPRPADSGTPHRAELVFDYDTPGRARLLARSVGQEVEEIEGDRTRAILEVHGTSVVVDVAADDLVALRAGVNTWSTLVEVAERVASVGDRTGASTDGTSTDADGG